MRERPSKGEPDEVPNDLCRHRESTADPPSTWLPFIDGFALINVKSKQEALEVAERFMRLAGDGEGEVLQVFDPTEVPR